MRSSCISHPEEEPLIIIRQWQMIAAKQNKAGAALLSFFEYWHNIKIDQSGKAHQFNAVAEKHGDKPHQDTSLYQFHTAEQLERGLLIFKVDAIRQGIQILIEQGFVSVHKNPNPRYAFDNTRHFLFHVDEVRKWLEGYTLSTTGKPGHRQPENQRPSPENQRPSPENQRPSPENQRPSPENQRPSPENRRTIPETTPEITPETSTETTHTKTPLPPEGECVCVDLSLKESEPRAEEVLSPSPCLTPNNDRRANSQTTQVGKGSATAPAAISQKLSSTESEPASGSISSDSSESSDPFDLSAPSWSLDKAPWRMDAMSFKPSVLQAVFDAFSGGAAFKLADGSRNGIAISAHLEKLESAVRKNSGNDSIDARRKLKRYWEAAQVIEQKMQEREEREERSRTANKSLASAPVNMPSSNNEQKQGEEGTFTVADGIRAARAALSPAMQAKVERIRNARNIPA